MFCLTGPLKGQHTDMLSIRADFPGGNVLIERIHKDTVWIAPDTRNISGDWFYWYFSVQSETDREIHFVFSKHKIPSFGPAISQDGGETWQWMFDGLNKGMERFSFSFKGGREVRFSIGFPYLQANYDKFIAQYASHPLVQLDTLCLLKSGRAVPMLHINNVNVQKKGKVVLTARHHACEMMASYTLEGMIAAMLETDKFKWLTDHFDILIIPFVDLDGVENGDQGKSRTPRDHNRDYSGKSIHETTRAIREFLPAWVGDDFFVALDLHCPGLVGRDHELLYLVGSKAPTFAEEEKRFSHILSLTSTNGLSFKEKSLLEFGTSWNVGGSERLGDSFRTWVQNSFVGAKLVTILEVPYANNEGQRVSIENLELFGGDLVDALEKYLKSL